jgi:lipoprotein NlpI
LEEANGASVAAIMRTITRVWLSKWCVLGLVAAALCSEAGISSAHADGRDLARAALLAKASEQCAAAVGLFDEALRQGDFAGKEQGFLIYNRGVCYEKLGVRQRALSDLNAAIALLPDFENAYIYRGLVWGELRDFDRAIADFQQADRLKPGDPLVFNNLGNAFAAKDDPVQAIANYNRAIELRGDYAQAYYNRASVYRALRDDTRALADYNEAIRFQPTFIDAYTNRGVLRMARGEVPQALADFDAALNLNPQDLTALTNRANAYLVANRSRDALEDFSYVITIDRGNAAAYLGRGRTALLSDGSSNQRTIDDFLTAHRLQPTSAYTVLWLHIARLHRGEDDAKEFKDNSEKVKRDTWPGRLLDLFNGNASQEQVWKAAKSGSMREQNERTCEVNFFIGEKAVQNKSKAEARSSLMTAVNECPSDEAGYYVAAKIELNLLDQ